MKKSLILVIWLQLYSPVSFANEDEFMRLINLSLEDLLNETIVTATKTNLTTSQIPAAATIFTRAEIEQLPVQYLHELLSYAPGYQYARELDFSYQYSVSSRGRKTGGAGREVLFLLDGVAVNGPRNGNAGSMFMYPVTNIEKVEVIRGPGSALYGSNAITGVVNVISRKGNPLTSLMLGANNQVQFYGLASQSWRGWQLDTGLFYYKDSGHSYSVKDSFGSQQIKTSDPLKQTGLRLSASNQTTHISFNYRELDAEDFFNVGRVSDKHNFSKHKSTNLSVKHNLHFFDDIETSISVSYLHINSVNGNQSTPEGQFALISEPPSNEALYGYGEFDSQRVHFNLQNIMALSEGANLVFGFEVKDDAVLKAKGYTNFDLVALSNQQYPVQYYGGIGPGVDIAKKNTINVQSLYGQYISDISAKLQGVIGARIDKYNNLPTQSSPRLALIYQHKKNEVFKLLYGEAFRSPTLAELDFINTLTVLGNTELKHEIVKTLDLIWLKQWTSAQLQLGAFVSQFEDPIIDKIENDVRTFTNGDNDRIKGVELETQLQPSLTSFIRFTVSKFWTHSSSLQREATTTASLSANQQYDSVNLNVSMNYIGERNYFTPSNTISAVPSVWLTSLKLTKQINEKVKAHATIKNLFDEPHISPPIGNTLEIGIPNRGREWGIELQYQF